MTGISKRAGLNSGEALQEGKAIAHALSVKRERERERGGDKGVT